MVQTLGDESFPQGQDEIAVLWQLSKTEAIGAIAAGLAHDFNSLLTPVAVAMTAMQRGDKTRPNRHNRRIEQALACERAQRLVNRILNLSRMLPLDKAPVNIADLLNGMDDIFAGFLPRKIFLELDLPRNLPTVTIDRDRFETALLNLVINARDAMPDGGRITVSAAEELFVSVSDAYAVRRMLRISVADTGTGMDDTTLHRATEPLFSTKETGAGTGLGLPLVSAIIKQLDGHFSMTSKVGIGTTIDLWLPVAETEGDETKVRRGDLLTV
jgi:signal transduction histidine kinase